MEDKKTGIFNAAMELFRSKGFKDTNVSDIAELAEIGVGTFYNYYPSKEKLFLEVYFKENEAQKKHLFESMDLNDDPATMITSMVVRNASEMNSNRILKEWYNKELFRKLEKAFYEQNAMENLEEKTRDGSEELIRMWKAEGKIRNDIADDMINAIFKSILYIDLHKDDIGIQHFPQILFHITAFIMKGLTDFKK